MENSASAYYRGRISHIETNLLIFQKRSRYLMGLRLFTFIGFITFLILGVAKGDYLYGLLSFLTFSLFLLAIKLDLSNQKMVTALEAALSINSDEFDGLVNGIINGKKGDEFSYLNPNLAADFDLFGEKSLYSYICRCATVVGKEHLAKVLVAQNINIEDINKKQEAIKELSEKRAFIEAFQVEGYTNKDEKGGYRWALKWLEQKESNSAVFKYISMVYPWISVITISLAISTVIPSWTVGLLYFTGLAIMGLSYNSINVSQSKFDKSAALFKRYSGLIALIETHKFASPHLQSLQNNFTSTEKASQSLRTLFKLLNRLELRLNFLFAGFVNPFILLDLRTHYALNKWKSIHSEAILKWFSSLGEIDALMSFGVYAFNNQQTITYPTLVNDGFHIEVEEINHPLIQANKSISNSFSITGSPSISIITGANMAGKSTFLRTIGINLILAQCGAPVNAKRVVWQPCYLISSIKVQDSLAENQSYFYAELLRLKEILEFVKQKPNTLVVLDEILRGTNTKDKHLGSVGLIENLIHQNTHLLIATHDLAVGTMADQFPNTVKNFSFEVELKGDELIFDYKIKKGVAEKLNAFFLMKRMGIIE